MVAVTLVGFTVFRFWGAKEASAPQSKAISPVAHAAPDFSPPPHSIAVLPFVNMSGDKDQEYFSDGLTEELLNSLAEITQLQVAARTSAFVFKGKDSDIGTIARKLNVATVLEGSVRRSGNQVRVSTDLINAVSGFHLWSHTYERDLREVFKVQTEIATAVADALKVTLLASISNQSDAGTRNPAALDAYLQGRRSFLSSHGAQDLLDAIAKFTEAIRLDPNYALAYCARGGAYVRYGGNFTDDSAKTLASMRRGEEDIRHALALEPDLPQAHAQLSVLSIATQNFAQADREVRRALELAPGDAAVLRSSGYFNVMMGRSTEGLEALRKAVVLDPLNLALLIVYGDALLAAGHAEEALSALAEALKLDPNNPETHGRRGFVYYSLGDAESARAACAIESDEWAVLTCRALAANKLGKRSEAEAALNRLRETSGDSAAYQYANIYAQRGETEKALDWLEKAYRLRDSGLYQLKTDYLMDPIRKEPRFQTIEKELNFPP
jgi:TolB-like protein/thioredoxin-like negative regulator of GroEL